MEAKQKYLLRRKCWRKSGSWQTLKGARLVARKIFKESGLQLYAYWCSHCDRAHLTKQRSAKGRVL